MSEWMPIESAPKDGTEILVYCPGGSAGEVCVSAYLPNTVRGSGFGSIHSCCGYEIDVKPSHWMPLPEPPK